MPIVTYMGPEGHSVFAGGMRFRAGVETEVSEEQVRLVRELGEQGYQFEVNGSGDDEPAEKPKKPRRSKT